MPTPSQLAKSGTEHGEQTALFAWAAVATYRGFDAANNELTYTDRTIAQSYGTFHAVPELKWFHAIPNGGSRGDDAKSRAIRGGQLKAEGQKNGVFDTFWPCPRGGFAGLYIEMKAGKGRVSDEQKEFGEFVSLQGYAVKVCYNWRDAADIVEAYWKGGRRI